MHNRKLPIRLKRIAKLSLAICILALSIPLILRTRSFFTVKRVVCYTNGPSDCPPEIAEKLKFLENKSIFSINTPTLDVQDFEFDIVSTKVIFPNTVIVTTSLPRPVAILVTSGMVDTQTSKFLVNENGVINPIVAQPPPQLPIIISHLALPTALGYKLKSGEILAAIALLSYLEPSNPKHLKIATSPGQMEISGLSNFTILASTLKSPIETATTLQQVLKSPTINKLSPKTVDIRFSQPVVIFQ